MPETDKIEQALGRELAEELRKQQPNPYILLIVALLMGGTGSGFFTILHPPDDQDRYTGSKAEKDWALQAGIDKAQNERLTKVESLCGKIEKEFNLHSEIQKLRENGHVPTR